MIGKKDIQQLPRAPGVYYFYDTRKRILYIGKAKIIRERVRQHFVSPHSNLQHELMRKTAAVKYQVTENHLEAIIREGEAIKKYKPPYNIVWKDDKNFFFIGITREDNPKIFITHQPTPLLTSPQNGGRKKGKHLTSPPKREGGKRGDGSSLEREGGKKRKVFPSSFRKGRVREGITTFGPFVEKEPVMEIMRALRIVFGVRSGGDLIRRARGLMVSGASWQEVVREIRAFFKSGVRALIKKSEKAMRAAAANEDFERAVYFRDKTRRLNRFLQGQIAARAAAQEAEPIMALEEIKTIFGLPRLPQRIEGYDASCIQGKFAVASMVVALDGRLAKSEYRKFKIKTVPGADDVAMLKEAISRRLAHGLSGAHQFWPWPDLFLIDGGKPQVGAVLAALKNFEAVVPVVGLAKRDERLIIKNRSAWREIHLDRSHHGLRLLQQVRDEAHRFARRYFSLLHKKQMIK